MKGAFNLKNFPKSGHQTSIWGDIFFFLIFYQMQMNKCEVIWSKCQINYQFKFLPVSQISELEISLQVVVIYNIPENHTKKSLNNDVEKNPETCRILPRWLGKRKFGHQYSRLPTIIEVWEEKKLDSCPKNFCYTFKFKHSTLA